MDTKCKKDISRKKLLCVKLSTFFLVSRFAFAETDNEEEIQKAIKAMDSKEIHGRRLRVRSSKDKDRNDKAEAARKKFQPKRELTENDVTKHLVYAFMGFLGRQMEVEGLEDEVKSKIETAKDLLKESFDIPEDETLKVSRNLELIFLQNNRREIPVPKDETKEEEEDIDAKEVQAVTQTTMLQKLSKCEVKA